MPKFNKMKVNNPLWSIVACIGFFLVGLFVGRKWLKLPIYMTNSSKPAKSALLTFNVPQISLPPNWSSKENLPGNSFETAFSLNTGVQTQGTLNEDNAVDYFFFTLKDSSQVIIDVTNVPKSLYWVLYDSEFREVTSTYRTGASKGSTQVSLHNAGKYYIKVWADYTDLTNYPYTIRLNILPNFE